MDESNDYVDKDLPPPKTWVLETLVTVGLILTILGFVALIALYSVATGPRFD